MLQLLDAESVGSILLRLPPWFQGPLKRELPNRGEVPLMEYFLPAKKRQKDRVAYQRLCKRVALPAAVVRHVQRCKTASGGYHMMRSQATMDVTDGGPWEEHDSDVCTRRILRLTR